MNNQVITAYYVEVLLSPFTRHFYTLVGFRLGSRFVGVTNCIFTFIHQVFVGNGDTITLITIQDFTIDVMKYKLHLTTTISVNPL